MNAETMCWKQYRRYRKVLQENYSCNDWTVSWLFPSHFTNCLVSSSVVGTKLFIVDWSTRTKCSVVAFITVVSLSSVLVAPTNLNRLRAFFTFHVATPVILALTALLDLKHFGCMTTPTTKIQATTLSSCLWVTLPTRCPESPSGKTTFAVVGRRIQEDEIISSVWHFSPRLKHFLTAALVFSDHVDDSVIPPLQKGGYIFELLKTSETCLCFARTRHAVASANSLHFFSDSLKLKRK